MVNLSQHCIEGLFNIDVVIMKIGGIRLSDDDQGLNNDQAFEDEVLWMDVIQSGSMVLLMMLSMKTTMKTSMRNNDEVLPYQHFLSKR